MSSTCKRTGFYALVTLLILLCCVQSSQATVVFLPADDDMIVGARAIVRGKVLSITSSFDEHQDRIYTYITLKVQEVLKGQINERQIVLKELGGVIDDQALVIFGSARYRVGERVLLYLDTWQDGSLRTRDMFLGKFNIIENPVTGQEMVERSAPDERTETLTRQPNIRHAHPEGRNTERLELNAYRRMVRDKLAENFERAVNFEAQYYANTPVLAAPPEFEVVKARGAVQTQFTLLGAWRFFEPDNGLPVPVTLNTTPPSGGSTPVVTLTEAQVTAAANAWSNVSNSSLDLLYTGILSSCYTTTTNLGIHIVSNNCDGQHSPSAGCASILAIGGFRLGGTQTKMIGGTNFRQAIQGFVSFNPWANCFFGNSCNVQEIMTHEIGHALGLGHSSDPDATMYFQAHFDTRCASLRFDDETGIRFIYPPASGSTPLSITTTSLPNGSVGASYSQTLTASGGTPNYFWAVSAGTLPAGLNLIGSTITGTPTASGVSNFTIRVTDSLGINAQRNLSITINSTGGGTPYNSQFVSQTVPTAVSPGQSFNVTLKWLNTGTQTWSGSGGFRLASQNPALNTIWGGNSVLLPGFNIPPQFNLEVTFTAFAPNTPGTYNFQWQCNQESVGFFGQPSTNVVITVGSDVTISGQSSFEALNGAQFSHQFSATGGISPYTWSVAGGALPTGLNLNATGQLVGTPTVTGTFNFTVRATDAQSRTAQKAISFVVRPASTVTIQVQSTLQTVMGESVSYRPKASGGEQPYSWSLSSGALPTGLNFNSTTGEITGVASQLGSFNVGITVRDTAGQSDSGTLQLIVLPDPASIPAITKVKYKNGKKLIVLGERFQASAMLFINNVRQSQLSIGNRFTVKNLPLAPGTYEIRVENPNNVSSQTVRLVVN